MVKTTAEAAAATTKLLPHLYVYDSDDVLKQQDSRTKFSRQQLPAVPFLTSLPQLVTPQPVPRGNTDSYLPLFEAVA